MEINYKGTKINYITKNSGKEAILFLHGWGGNIDSFSIVSNLINDYQTKHILVDFPPFGKSGSIKNVWTLFDYASCINKILKKEKVKKVIIIAHSFGVRVAISLCNIYNIKVEKMIITGGAGLRPRKSIIRFFKKLYYKFVRLFNKHINLGSKDYKNLPPNMKKTFSNIVNKDLSNESKQIYCPVLLVYGNKDKETPLYMGKKFNKYIKRSKLIVFKNCGHFAYLEQLSRFVNETIKFIKE